MYVCELIILISLCNYIVKNQSKGWDRECTTVWNDNLIIKNLYNKIVRRGDAPDFCINNVKTQQKIYKSAHISHWWSSLPTCISSSEILLWRPIKNCKGLGKKRSLMQGLRGFSTWNKRYTCLFKGSEDTLVRWPYHQLTTYLL